MQFTTQILTYYHYRRCCVVNFVAREIFIFFSLYIRLLSVCKLDDRFTTSLFQEVSEVVQGSGAERESSLLTTYWSESTEPL